VKIDSRFLELTPSIGVEFDFDGQTVCAPDGANLAAALLAAGVSSLRWNAVSGSPRGAYCLMGACFECLVKIDGVSVRACQQTVKAGMLVTRLNHLQGGEDVSN
jgi:predicted molibdopterin-dependent oxidoreductase YjgC